MSFSNPHTILMTADTVGGVWNYALILTRALQKYEVEVHLATMGEPLRPDQWEEAGSLENLTIYESDYALEWMQKPWSEIEEAGKWLLSLEQKVNADVIHLNNYVHGNLQWNAPVLTVGHSCVLSWWKAVHHEKAPPEWETYAQKVKQGLQNSDVVIGITNFMLEELNNFYGPFSTSKVIYNAQILSNFKAADKMPVIFSMGRLWDEAKNIRALQQIAPSLPWPVYVAGDGQEKFDSSKTGSLHFLGKLSSQKVAEQLSKSAIYVMPARYEPFGLSILEAAASGCALVLGDIPTLRELWEDSALFADPEKPELLQEQLENLIHQPELREKMAKKAYDRAKYFSLQKMGKGYWSLYGKLYEAFHKQKETLIA